MNSTAADQNTTKKIIDLRTNKENLCYYEKMSGFSKKYHTCALNTTKEKIEHWIESGKLGLVQKIFPELNNDEREFLVTGMIPSEWEQIFG